MKKHGADGDAGEIPLKAELQVHPELLQLAEVSGENILHAHSENVESIIDLILLKNQSVQPHPHFWVYWKCPLVLLLHRPHRRI